MGIRLQHVDAVDDTPKSAFIILEPETQQASQLAHLIRFHEIGCTACFRFVDDEKELCMHAACTRVM